MSLTSSTFSMSSKWASVSSQSFFVLKIIYRQLFQTNLTKNKIKSTCINTTIPFTNEGFSCKNSPTQFYFINFRQLVPHLTLSMSNSKESEFPPTPFARQLWQNANCVYMKENWWLCHLHRGTCVTYNESFPFPFQDFMDVFFHFQFHLLDFFPKGEC